MIMVVPHNKFLPPCCEVIKACSEELFPVEVNFGKGPAFTSRVKIYIKEGYFVHLHHLNVREKASHNTATVGTRNKLLPFLSIHRSHSRNFLCLSIL